MIDYESKKVLLIAGGGTLGTYTAKELLRLGCTVEVICPEEKKSTHPRLKFHQSLATKELLEKLFRQTHYDGIVNFLHYPDFEEYKRIHPFLIANTDHLIFLSSYRVYANEQVPITETAPRLFDVSTDTAFLESDTYAIPKSKCEDYLKTECAGQPWTVVRPVISFSHRRMDHLMWSGLGAYGFAKKNETMLIPDCAKDLHAGLDWAGNSGKLIANLLFRKNTFGEIYTVSSGQNLTWEEVAQLYVKHVGVAIRICSEEEYLDAIPTIRIPGHQHGYMWRYDRKYDRNIDPSKILQATGLTQADFASIEEGIITELAILEEQA